MKRKPPKNQRPYASPSGKKARMVEVTGADLDTLFSGAGDINLPSLSLSNGKYYAKADELRKWRASQTTSSAEQT